MDRPLTHKRMCFETATLAVLVVAAYALTQYAGITVGVSSWTHLPLFNFAAFGMTHAQAVTWDNLIAGIFGAVLTVAVTGDWLTRRQILEEYKAQKAPTRYKSAGFRALHALFALVFGIALGLHEEIVFPSPDPGSPLSILWDGVAYRLLFLAILYFVLRYTPYVLVREYLRLTGKLTTD